MKDNDVLSSAYCVAAINDGHAGKIVSTALKFTGKADSAIHHGAVAALSHIFQFGDVRPLNTLFKGVENRPRDITALKQWVGHHSTVGVIGDDGIAKELKPLIKFSKEKGFYLVPGNGENIRKSLYDPDGLMKAKPFYAFKREGNGDDEPETLSEYKTRVIKTLKRLAKEAEEADMPDVLVRLLTEWQARIDKVQVREPVKNEQQPQGAAVVNGVPNF